MAQTILYYPTINIQDGTWLRNAILYWDEVSSIVPYENYPDFSPELLYLQELGVYKAVYPRNLFFSEFVKHVVRKLNIDKAVFLEMESSIQTLLEIEKEIQWIKTTDRPYLSIEAVVNELEDRKHVIVESVKDLITL